MGPYTLTLDGTGTGGWQLDNPITGTGGIIKNDANGTLSLSGTNTYSGATTISSGALTIGSAGQLGSGNYAGVITNNG
ncbi:MAG: autotransporter-associated beta strand repeat-containing protein, partial [Kiritimatiellaeota bacterium]|nr:autotransporter-associated beta strand repeat-containing protein [Kiritimatiellota bacterium]